MDQSYLTIFYIASGLYVLLLCIAGALDTWKYIIPNAITVALVALFVVTTLLLPFDMGWRDWLSHFGAAGAVLVGGAVLFAFKKMGGGDVKLITVTAMWAGPTAMAEFLVITTLAGGLLALLMISSARFGFAIGLAGIGRRGPKSMVLKEALPYGVAIAAGGFFVGGLLLIR